MESIRELFRIGYGPSSSHTMGPRTAAQRFKTKHPDAESYVATLYGSLAATGIGHLTDKAIVDVFRPRATEIIWKPETVLPFHTNGMEFEAVDAKGKRHSKWRIYSVGGGAIKEENETLSPKKSFYKMNKMAELLTWTDKYGCSLWEYVFECEGGIRTFLEEIWSIMLIAIHNGRENEGALPGGLHLQRKASSYNIKSKTFSGGLKNFSFVFAYALAVAEENAAGGKIVTAPTCGSCGVLPAALYMLQEMYHFSDIKIINALATAGLLGNLIKHNASIAGAEVGCAGEIGSACAMAAGAAAQLLGGSPNQVEYAAEMGLEHHLGLTCDPVSGLVQIPCIERNAMAASRALECATYAILSDGKHRIPFDDVVLTMYRTGRDLRDSYKETSTAGLAKTWKKG
ncbi:MAG: L-serine ammonia-lyase [bacterium]|nr:L-serine ammonia-lyase [bacterium]